MLIVYDSKTGNVERFVKKLRLQCLKITDDLQVHDDFLLITYTTGMGETPHSTIRFLNRSNHKHLIKGVVASGNRNWGKVFAASADNVSEIYNVPIVHKFEMAGLPSDVEKIKEEVKRLEVDRTKPCS